MKLRTKNKFIVVNTVVIFLILLGCNVTNDERSDDLFVDYFYIKFTDYIINMNAPTDTVSIDSFSKQANHLQNYFSSVDNKLLITRTKPDFHPSDTLRITAEGDTIRRNNWALVYKFYLSKKTSFNKIEENVENDSLIEWISPPVKFMPLQN